MRRVPLRVLLASTVWGRCIRDWALAFTPRPRVMAKPIPSPALPACVPEAVRGAASERPRESVPQVPPHSASPPDRRGSARTVEGA